MLAIDRWRLDLYAHHPCHKKSYMTFGHPHVWIPNHIGDARIRRYRVLRTHSPKSIAIPTVRELSIGNEFRSSVPGLPILPIPAITILSLLTVDDDDGRSAARRRCWCDTSSSAPCAVDFDVVLELELNLDFDFAVLPRRRGFLSCLTVTWSVMMTNRRGRRALGPLVLDEHTLEVLLGAMRGGEVVTMTRCLPVWSVAM